jgi:hypothetical protein
MTDQRRWRPVLFDCPRTGQKVQGLVAEDVTAAGSASYEPVSCLACSGVHFIDSHGNVLGTGPRG